VVTRPDVAVHIRLLGGFDVTVDGRQIPAERWRRRSAAGLVKLLALQPRATMPREVVLDQLWPDLLVDAAAPRLHVAAHHARTALGVRDGVVVADGTVALFPAWSLTVDVTEFERAARLAADTSTPEAAAAAVVHYLGDLLPDDLYEPWTEQPRERLRMLHRTLLRSSGRLEELVAADPLDEEARLSLVRRHIRLGRREAALRALDEMETLFRHELDLEPGPEATALRARAAALPEPSGRTPLPAPRNRLVGRRDDLQQLDTLLRRHRIVTITGPGGAGKSTLALATARRLLAEDASSPATDVVLAELAPVQDERGVVRAVAESAGIQGEAALHAGTLAGILAPRAVLLVLDNCEHLLDASAALVDAVLDSGTGARVLATSREPLGVDGEAVHRIGSLGAESAELFVERAVAAAGPGIATVEDPRVRDLCERLDGLPLAIELAAAQLRHLSLQELVDRLDDRLSLLVGGRPRAGPRHSALTATIEWSYRLLTESTRQVFVSLGVFPAGFDRETAQAVAGGPAEGDLTPLLGDLVAKSLVVHDPQAGRYRLLETIRLFAERLLDESGRRAEVTELLRQHVTRRSRAAPRVRTWLSGTAAARARDDLENVRLAFEASLACGDHRAAVDIALSMSTLWRNAVSSAEGTRWVGALRGRDLAPTERLWTLLLACDVALGSGNPRVLREAAGAAVHLAGGLDEPGATVIATINDTMVHLGDPLRAAHRLESAADQARALDEPGLERLARGYRVATLRLAGRAGDDEELRALTDDVPGADYDRYICLWVASLVALVNRDGQRLRKLMDAQLADLMSSGLRENWLTMYWGALTSISNREDYLPQLRRARRQAEAEGRNPDPDFVLALGYAAALRDDWERAAELLGAAGGPLLHDTAGFFHHALLLGQLVAPRLEPEALAAATARGASLALPDVLREHGL
jgi:predicted ATPase/DNA-binding SARP family transcriptional activator